MYSIISFLPELYFFVAVTVVFLYCLIYSLSSVLKYPMIYSNSVYLSIVSLVYTLVLFLNSNTYYFEYTIMYKTQNNVIFSEFFIIISIIILIVTQTYNKKNNIIHFEYIIFLLISLGSLFIFINVLNLILIYLILELQSILISVIISIKKFNRYSIEASIKYFILGSFSSLLFLFGISVIYGSTGMLSISEINLFFEYIEEVQNTLVSTSIKIASIFILVGLLFKIYSAPFHLWLPDIYEGSPTSVLVYISTVQLVVMVLFFLKIYYYVLFDIIKFKQIIVSFISVLTLLFGSVGALLQVKIKKLISYSAVTMNGFFLYSIIHNNSYLLETNIIYLIIYVITILLLFTLLLNMYIQYGSVIKIKDLLNIYNNNNVISNIFTMLIFSISGIPPFIGFITKLFWLKSLLIEYSVFTFLLILVFLIVSYYYIRLLKNIYYLLDYTHTSVNYLSSIKYESCICIAYIQLLLVYFIFNSALVTNFIKSLTINLLYFI